MEMVANTAAGKRGRPPGVATKRINTRFPAGLAEKIEYAAAVRGVAVSAFIHEAVAARADQVIEAESRWLLTREEAANLAAMIANPPVPNRKAKEAAKRAASSITIADWTLDPPANTQLLAAPLPTLIGAKAPTWLPAPQRSLTPLTVGPSKADPTAA